MLVGAFGGAYFFLEALPKAVYAAAKTEYSPLATSATMLLIGLSLFVMFFSLAGRPKREFESFVPKWAESLWTTGFFISACLMLGAFPTYSPETHQRQSLLDSPYNIGKWVALALLVGQILATLRMCNCAVPKDTLVAVNRQSFLAGENFMLWPWFTYDIEVFKREHPAKFACKLECTDGTYHAQLDTVFHLDLETARRADPRTLMPLSACLNDIWLANVLRNRASGKTLAEALPLLTQPAERTSDILPVRWDGKGLNITVS